MPIETLSTHQLRLSHGANLSRVAHDPELVLLITRPHNRNVVLLSEETYNALVRNQKKPKKGPVLTP